MKWYELVLALTIVGRVMAAQQHFDPPDFSLYHDKRVFIALERPRLNTFALELPPSNSSKKSLREIPQL